MPHTTNDVTRRVESIDIPKLALPTPSTSRTIPDVRLSIASEIATVPTEAETTLLAKTKEEKERAHKLLEDSQ
jgi:hypothetical protein